MHALWHRTIHVVAVMALCSGLAACASAPTSAAHPTATATAPIPPLQVRFVADWSQGLANWQATPGWTVTNSALESSTANGLSLTIPYTPLTSRFTIELDVQVLDVPRNGGGFILNVPAALPMDGYQVGVSHLLVPGPRPFGDHPTILALIFPQDDQAPAPAHLHEADYEPGDGVRVYRIVVDNPIVSLYVDDRFYVSAAGAGTAPLASGPLTLQVNGVHLRITGLRVMA